MDLQNIFTKLDSMSEQISKLRESAARTEGVLAETLKDTRQKHDHIQTQVESIVAQQNQWKGATIVISSIFGAGAAVLVRWFTR